MAQTATKVTEEKLLAPGPAGNLLLGNIGGYRKQGPLGFWLDVWREYGDITRVKMGPMIMHQFVDPEAIRHVLVQNPANYPKGFSHDKLRLALGNGVLTSESPLWDRQRRLMQPTYTPKAVAKFADIMVDSTEQMKERWFRDHRGGDMLTINAEMMHLAMSVISRSMFGMDISENFADAGEALMVILEFAAKRSMSMIDPPMFLPTPMNRRFKWALHTIDSFLYGIIEQRRLQPPGDDLLSLLMTARDEDTGEVMGDKQLRDEVLITFFAGHETTAQTLTWAWYLLSKNPIVEERLHAELEQVLNGRLPTVQDLPNLPYTRMIVDETLRLFSPVALMARDPLEDDEVCGYAIPGGSLVTLSPFITHRHPAFWDNPEAFIPERFEPAEVKKRPRYAYFPFGAGQRICLGQHFALLEATLVLADLAQRFHFELAPGLSVEPQFMGTLRPNRDVLMMLRWR